MRRFVLAAFALTVFAACQPATTELTEEQNAAIEEEVRRVFADFDEAFNTGDLDRWRSHLADDVRWGGDGGFSGIEQMVEGAEAYMAMDMDVSGETEDLFVRVLSPDAALVGAVYHMTTVLPNGETSEGGTVMTCVWSRVEGVWKVVHGQFTEASM